MVIFGCHPYSKAASIDVPVVFQSIKDSECHKPIVDFICENCKTLLKGKTATEVCISGPSAPHCPCLCFWVWMDTFQLDSSLCLETTAGLTPHPNKALC